MYALRVSLIAALTNPQSDILSYTIGDRTVQCRSIADLEPLNKMINYYESIVTADVVVISDMGGLANRPSGGRCCNWPDNFGC